MQTRTITVGVDLTSRPEAVLGQAAQVARPNRATIHVVSAIAPHSGLLRRDYGERERVKQVLSQLEEVAGPVLQDGAGAVYLHVRWGQPAEEIVRVAVEAGADLIVIGALQGNLSRHGSVARQILEWAACSVLVVEPNREHEQAGGLVPHFPLCGDCVSVRSESKESSRWFCKTHDEAELRAFSVAHAGG